MMLSRKSDVPHCTHQVIPRGKLIYELLTRIKRVPESIRKPIRWVAVNEHHNYVTIEHFYITYKLQFDNNFSCYIF